MKRRKTINGMSSGYTSQSPDTSSQSPGPGPPNSIILDDTAFKQSVELKMDIGGPNNIWKVGYFDQIVVSNPQPVDPPQFGSYEDLMSKPMGSLEPYISQFWLVEWNQHKHLVWNGLGWQCGGETIQLNGINGDIYGRGTIVQIGESEQDSSYEPTRAAGTNTVIGVVGIASPDNVGIATRGIWPVLCVAGTYNAGWNIVTSDEVGMGKQTNSVAKAFAKCIQNITLENPGLVMCFVHTCETY